MKRINIISVCFCFFSFIEIFVKVQVVFYTSSEFLWYQNTCMPIKHIQRWAQAITSIRSSVQMYVILPLYNSLSLNKCVYECVWSSLFV